MLAKALLKAVKIETKAVKAGRPTMLESLWRCDGCGHEYRGQVRSDDWGGKVTTWGPLCPICGSEPERITEAEAAGEKCDDMEKRG